MKSFLDHRLFHRVLVGCIFLLDAVCSPLTCKAFTYCSLLALCVPTTFHVRVISVKALILGLCVGGWVCIFLSHVLIAVHAS